MRALFPRQAGFFSDDGSRRSGFTIIELLTGMAIFAVVLVVLLSTISQTSSIWRRAKNEAGSFQSARFAFNLITRNLSQSTLNTYVDYDNPGQPTKYIRKSDLAFVITPPPLTNFGQGNAIFFQAKLGAARDLSRHGGMNGLLNAVGYYVTYDTYATTAGLPAFLVPHDRHRFRLMQYLQPTEDLKVSSVTNRGWYTDDLAANSTVVADDVILLLFWPRLAEKDDSTADGTKLTDAPNGDGTYSYDSRANASASSQPDTANQQPPLVQVTMVAIDKASADRLDDSPTPPTQIKSILNGLFTQAGKSEYQADLQKLEASLNAARIGYRIFNGTVALRESKWSK